MKDLLKSNTQHLKKLWNDTASVYRRMPYEKDNGATGEKFVCIHAFMQCHYSQKQTTVTQTESSNNIEYTHNLYFDTNIDVQAGDEIWILIKDTNIIRGFNTTEPALYFSHHSVGLKRKEFA